MATELPTTNGHSAQDGENNFAVKAGLARMLKGGVIMDVINAEQVSRNHHIIIIIFSRQPVNANTRCQARIAEEAGACAVMALERVPADIRSQGGVARMSDPQMIKEIMDTVTIPVMAKARIGHFVECQVPFSPT
jgi:pyridoxal 5'-phosphate synthase pdxS subunit